MHSYVIDSLSPDETEKLRQQLENLELNAGLDGLYWLPVPPALHSPTQQQHAGTCGPYSLALELDEERLSLELLVRARNQLHCDCIALASPELRAHMLNWLDNFVHSTLSDKRDGL